MEKIGDIRYSCGISIKQIKESECEYEAYFLLVDLGLTAESSPASNYQSHKFGLPISKQKYEELQERLKPTRGYLKQIGELSLSLNQGELELLINKVT